MMVLYILCIVGLDYGSFYSLCYLCNSLVVCVLILVVDVAVGSLSWAGILILRVLRSCLIRVVWVCLSGRLDACVVVRRCSLMSLFVLVRSCLSLVYNCLVLWCGCDISICLSFLRIVCVRSVFVCDSNRLLTSCSSLFALSWEHSLLVRLDVFRLPACSNIAVSWTLNSLSCLSSCCTRL